MTDTQYFECLVKAMAQKEREAGWRDLFAKNPRQTVLMLEGNLIASGNREAKAFRDKHLYEHPFVKINKPH